MKLIYATLAAPALAIPTNHEVPQFSDPVVVQEDIPNPAPIATMDLPKVELRESVVAPQVDENTVYKVNEWKWNEVRGRYELYDPNERRWIPDGAVGGTRYYSGWNAYGNRNMGLNNNNNNFRWEFINGQWEKRWNDGYRRPLTTTTWRPRPRPQNVDPWWTDRPVTPVYYQEPRKVEVVQPAPVPVQVVDPLPTIERVRPMTLTQSRSMDPWLWHFMLNRNSDDQMSMLLPLIMANRQQEPIGLHSPAGVNMMTNPLFFLSLIDEADDKESCLKKYEITDDDASKLAANPVIANGDFMLQQDFDAINYKYMGCLSYAAEEDANDDDFLFPLLMQSMNGDGHGMIDPMMLLALNGNHNSKSMLPFLMMSSNAMQLDPATMMLFMEETACELKFHIPKKHYLRDPITTEVTVVEDAAANKAFFMDKFSDYKKCVDSVSSDDNDDNMLFWLMMMGMPTTA